MATCASSLFRGTRVRFARFLPPRLWPPRISINLRNHRKILVVDGLEAFTGGINVRDRYLDELGDERIVDSHFRVSGPVLAQIETVFLRDWQFATGDAIAAGTQRAATHRRPRCAAPSRTDPTPDSTG